MWWETAAAGVFALMSGELFGGGGGGILEFARRSLTIPSSSSATLGAAAAISLSILLARGI